MWLRYYNVGAVAVVQVDRYFIHKTSLKNICKWISLWRLLEKFKILMIVGVLSSPAPALCKREMTTLGGNGRPREMPDYYHQYFTKYESPYYGRCVVVSWGVIEAGGIVFMFESLLHGFESWVFSRVVSHRRWLARPGAAISGSSVSRADRRAGLGRPLPSSRAAARGQPGFIA